MNLRTVIAIALILYGATTLYIAFVKPRALWNIGKIQGFVQLLTERGTVILFTIVGAAALAGGAALLWP